MKKKLIAISLAVVLVLTLGATAIFAGGDQIPSAKAAFVSDDVYGMTVDKEDTGWITILTAKIKTGDPKDLIIDVSAECSLVTNAKLSGTLGSEAIATILVRVMVDGVEADPGVVTFNNRVLKVEGDLTHHYGGLPLDIDDHWFEIFLSTKSANAFNFCAEDVGSGVHTVVVQAMTHKEEKGLKGTANAYIGNVSAVIDEVMLKRMD
jgi:hypothetical protein